MNIKSRQIFDSGVKQPAGDRPWHREC